MIRRIALIASALTGLPLLAAWIISQRVLHPKAKVEDHNLTAFPLPVEEVSFPARDGTRLAGWFIPAAEQTTPGPAVVLAHGWGRSRAELLPHAALLHRAGFSVLAFDQRHRGKSEGDTITMGLREQGDLQGALDVLAARPQVDSERIGVFGMSLGGVVTLLVAARDTRVSAIVVEGPFSSNDAIMTRSLHHYYRLPAFPIAHLAKWVMEQRLGESLDSVYALPAVRALGSRPLFIIANGRDAVVGPEEACRLFAAAGDGAAFWLVPEADHACGWQAAPEEYERRVVAFFREALAVRSEAAAYAGQPGRANVGR